MKRYKRTIRQKVVSGLNNGPVVLLNGPRQAGKSTLARDIGENAMGAEYITFDDITALALASDNPEGFLKQFPKPVVLDEVQMVPALFRSIKKNIDELRYQEPETAKGRFLLTGSANIMALPGLSDALVGRIGIHTLGPLSVGETLGTIDSFVTAIFSDELSLSPTKPTAQTPLELIPMATFPEIAGKDAEMQASWADNYLTTLVQRDIKQLADIEKISIIPNMIQLLASRVGSTVNDSSLARELSVNTMTGRRYSALLENIFLINKVAPWFNNSEKRLVKSPKLYFTDTFLLCHILGVDLEKIALENPVLMGKIIENFVASEMLKQLTWHKGIDLYHFRTQSQKEVDFILEKRGGQAVAIEVKAKHSVKPSDFNGIRAFKEMNKNKFVRGIVLYLGDKLIPYEDDMAAVPIDALWTLGTKPID